MKLTRISTLFLAAVISLVSACGSESEPPRNWGVFDSYESMYEAGPFFGYSGSLEWLHGQSWWSLVGPGLQEDASLGTVDLWPLEEQWEWSRTVRIVVMISLGFWEEMTQAEKEIYGTEAMDKLDSDESIEFLMSLAEND